MKTNINQDFFRVAHELHSSPFLAWRIQKCVRGNINKVHILIMKLLKNDGGEIHRTE
jgi:hypothetical protein